MPPVSRLEEITLHIRKMSEALHAKSTAPGECDVAAAAYERMSRDLSRAAVKISECAKAEPPSPQ